MCYTTSQVTHSRLVTLQPEWRTPALQSLARLDLRRTAPLIAYPILGDALEEDADCTNADILAHLRSPGPHVRGGCWAAAGSHSRQAMIVGPLLTPRPPALLRCRGDGPENPRLSEGMDMSDAELVRPGPGRARTDAYAELARRWAARITAPVSRQGPPRPPRRRTRPGDAAARLARPRLPQRPRTLRRLAVRHRPAHHQCLDWLKAKQNRQVPFSRPRRQPGLSQTDRIRPARSGRRPRPRTCNACWPRSKPCRRAYRQVILLYYYRRYYLTAISLVYWACRRRPTVNPLASPGPVPCCAQSAWSGRVHPVPPTGGEAHGLRTLSRTAFGPSRPRDEAGRFRRIGSASQETCPDCRKLPPRPSACNTRNCATPSSDAAPAVADTVAAATAQLDATSVRPTPKPAPHRPGRPTVPHEPSWLWIATAVAAAVLVGVLLVLPRNQRRTPPEADARRQAQRGAKVGDARHRF